MTRPISPSAAAERPALRVSAMSSLLQHWHLLSLDAPTVAIVWTLAFAHVAHVRLPLLSPLLLALATWLLYVADRILDGCGAAREAILRERHHFHKQHRAAFVAVGLPILALLFWLVVAYMQPSPRHEDILLGAAASLYLLIVHLPRRSQPKAALRAGPVTAKEAAVGLIFAAACVIPAWSRLPAPQPRLLLAGILFAALCWLNCAAISVWESDQASLPRAHSLFLRNAALGIATVAISSVLANLTTWTVTPLYLCIVGSAVLLLLLDRLRARLAPLQLRALADLVLLTPVFLLLPWRVG